MDVVKNPKSKNFGRQLLKITMMVTEGTYKGFEEIFHRVLNPQSLDEPTKEDISKAVKEFISNSPDISKEKAKEKFLESWKEKVLKYYSFTLRQFAYLGVDTSSKDEEIILRNVANLKRVKTVWKVYGKSDLKDRRAFIENSNLYFKPSPKKEMPILFDDEQPNDSDFIPLD